MAEDCPTAVCTKVLMWIDRFWFLALFLSFGPKTIIIQGGALYVKKLER